MKKSGFAKGVIWTLSIGIVLVFVAAAIGVVAYNGYTNAALEATYSKGNTETTIKIEKKDKLSSEIVSKDKKQVKLKEGIFKDKTKLNFKESGPFYGIKKNGKKFRGILIGPKMDDGQSDWYGTFGKKGAYLKGYFKHTYPDGEILYQYTEYGVDSKGIVIREGKSYKVVDQYLISKEDFDKVKLYIQYDIELPFSFYDFDIVDETNTYGTFCLKKNFVSVHKFMGATCGSNYFRLTEEQYYIFIDKGREISDKLQALNSTDQFYETIIPEFKKLAKKLEVFTKDNQQKSFAKKICLTMKQIGFNSSGYPNYDFIPYLMKGSSCKNKDDILVSNDDYEFYLSKLKKTDSLKKEKIFSDEKYYALVIGNNNYEYLEKLDAAENDAVVIADVLENKYGFEVDLLLNADYDTTVNSLFNITNKLKNNDNLLIYYAGHGELDKDENRGYWLPVDASYEMRSKWISNQRIVDRIKATKAKHVLLVADSCFSGTLMRSGDNLKKEQSIDEKYIKRLKNKKTRLVITSGGNEPVVDSVGGEHSLFALKFIDTLKNNNTVINSQILFENVRRYVVANADQTPERAMVHKTGHDGGDFLFFPKK